MPADFARTAEAAIAQPTRYYRASVFGLDEICSASFEDGRYWLLAEVPDVGMLGVRDQSADREVYLLFYDGRQALGLGNSFKDAVERAGQFATGL